MVMQLMSRSEVLCKIEAHPCAAGSFVPHTKLLFCTLARARKLTRTQKTSSLNPSRLLLSRKNVLLDEGTALRFNNMCARSVVRMRAQA